jgi:hypothetical protein
MTRTMKTYSVLFAEDVPHYGSVEIEAASDGEALAKARALWGSGADRPTDDPDWSSTICHRIVLIEDDCGRETAHDVPLDDYVLRRGDPVPELLAVLEEAGRIPWVANAAITDDIEALRAICVAYADWWNGRACPAVAKAKGRAS